MATAPEVPNFPQFDFKEKDTTQIIIKDNGRNAALKRFGESLKVMTDSINVDLETMEGQKTTTQQAAQAGSESAQQVAADKQAVASDRQHVDQQKQAIDTTAGQVDDHARQVAEDRAAVVQNTQTATQAAQDAGAAAGASIQAKDAAQALYGDLLAVDAAKTQAQQAAASAGEERSQAESARSGAQTAQSAAETAAAQSQQASSAAVKAHEEKDDPHGQYQKTEDLKEGAFREVVGGDSPLMAEGAHGYGGLITQPTYPLSSLEDDPTSVPSGEYRVSSVIGGSPAGIGYVSVRRYNSTVIKLSYESVNGLDTLWRTYSGGAWNTPWNRVYDTTRLLGRVAFIGDRPNGGIFEVGSNDDGMYVKLASGDYMAQRIVKALTVNTFVNYSLPIPDAIIGTVTNTFSCRVDVSDIARRATVRDHSMGGAINWSLGFNQVGSYTPANVDLSLFSFGKWRNN